MMMMPMMMMIMMMMMLMKFTMMTICIMTMLMTMTMMMVTVSMMTMTMMIVLFRFRFVELGSLNFHLPADGAYTSVHCLVQRPALGINIWARVGYPPKGGIADPGTELH